MSTRKVGDLPARTCLHPNHDPPTHQVFENGVYEHGCSGCGQKQRFIVAKPTLTASPLTTGPRARLG